MSEFHHVRRAAASTLAVAAVSVAAVAAVSAPPVTARQVSAEGRAGRVNAPAPSSAGSITQTTLRYVTRFWPRYLSHAQQTAAGTNQLIGPATMGPQYHSVVAINDDTLYASAFVDVSHGPVVLTIPRTPVTYSLETVDLFGSSFPTGIAARTPGAYALVASGWHGTLPPGLTRVVVPYPTTVWIFRADKHTHTGQDVTAQAAAFRASVRLAPLADFRKDPTGGATQVLPVTHFSVSFKLLEDRADQLTPTAFLRGMQRAVHDPSTAPLSASDLRLSQEFDQAFQVARQSVRNGHSEPLTVIDSAARSAYSTIVAHWQTHTGATNWVHFSNIADWGTADLDRAAATEYLQYGNTNNVAAYWQAFQDGAGRPLNGAGHGYQLTFKPDQIPQTTRFWSITAYTPDTVELVPNAAHKYVVAGYTPGLRANPDGSITVYLQPDQPANAPTANWLPVPSGPFSVILRAYGPTGNTTGTYLPPPITPAGDR